MSRTPKPATDNTSKPASKSPSKVTITKDSGGSIKTVLGYGFVLNKDSTLEREWITLHDPDMPAEIAETAGVKTAYKSDYRYTSTFTVIAREPLSALEVRFLTFDAWGTHVRNLSFDHIADLNVGPHLLQAEWQMFSENEAEAYYASIGYVSKVRTKDGRVRAMDIDPVVEEARRLSAKFSAEDLEQEKTRK